MDLSRAADARLALGDSKAALAEYRQSLAILQQLAGADPSNMLLRAAVGEAMAKLAATPGSNLAWTQVAAQLEGAAGHLSPADEDLLAAARTHAAAAPASVP